MLLSESWSAALAATEGPAAVAAIIDKRLAGLERAKSFVDWDQCRGARFGPLGQVGDDLRRRSPATVPFAGQIRSAVPPAPEPLAHDRRLPRTIPVRVADVSRFPTVSGK
jgi:hypothetical protein